MHNQNVEDLARQVEADDDYRVLRRLKVPNQYCEPDGRTLRRGVYLDIETTGLDLQNDAVIELAALEFDYADDGRIFTVYRDRLFCALNDPLRPIPEEITKITGITTEMVQGKFIDPEPVQEIIDRANLIVAHNAAFDRPIVERYWPIFREKPWACSWQDIAWNEEGMKAAKLDYLAFKFGYFFDDAHRAAGDVSAGVALLGHDLPGSGKLAMAALLENARKNTIRIWAVNSPFELKDLMKARGYRWANGDGKYRAWYVDVAKAEQEAELDWLREEIYDGRAVSLPSETMDAFSRYKIS